MGYNAISIAVCFLVPREWKTSTLKLKNRTSGVTHPSSASIYIEIIFKNISAQFCLKTSSHFKHSNLFIYFFALLLWATKIKITGNFWLSPAASICTMYNTLFNLLNYLFYNFQTVIVRGPKMFGTFQVFDRVIRN